MGSLFTLSYHPKEAQLIGSIFAGYGEIEFQWTMCLGLAIDDLGSAIRALYRHHGESMRIDVGDALMRSHYKKANLSDHYETGLGAIRHSKSIRNQYAHAHWFAGPQLPGLCFLDFEQAAKSAVGNVMINRVYVDEPLLKQQYEYLDYTLAHLTYLASAYERFLGKTPIHDWPIPKRPDVPPLQKRITTQSDPTPSPSGEAAQ